jgi:hypothetical protein
VIKMNRRTFITSLIALPFVKAILPKPVYYHRNPSYSGPETEYRGIIQEGDWAYFTTSEGGMNDTLDHN